MAAGHVAVSRHHRLHKTERSLDTVNTCIQQAVRTHPTTFFLRAASARHLSSLDYVYNNQHGFARALGKPILARERLSCRTACLQSAAKFLLRSFVRVGPSADDAVNIFPRQYSLLFLLISLPSQCLLSVVRCTRAENAVRMGGVAPGHSRT